MPHFHPTKSAQTLSGNLSGEAHAIPLSLLFAQLRSSEQGLTNEEARKRLDTSGPNEAIEVKRHSGLVQFLRLFLNPLVLILLIASSVSLVLGDRINASIILAIVLLSNVLNFVQTSSSQHAVEQLRAGVAPTANALRGGARVELPRRNLVPGDVIRLTAGDLVPADARLVQANDLHVQQAALTGESLPVEKRADDLVLPEERFAEAHNRVFLGTSVTNGSVSALVIATGGNTAFGDIAARLTSHAPETEFERGIKSFGMLILQAVFFLVLFISLVGILGRHQPFETILFAISLAVGLTPEFLPMITTVTLGQGALRMAKHKVIVKHLEAIQNFGRIDTLCSDKTGTLTSGETRLEGSLDLSGQESSRVLLLGYVNSRYETGIKSPLDEALLRAPQVDIRGYTRIGEIPFDFERRRLSVVVQQDDHCLLITKGAPESILPLCSAYEIHDECQPFDDVSGDMRTACVKKYQDLSRQGYRVLAVAYRLIPRQAQYQKTEEQSLILLGFLTFADPPKPDVAQVLRALGSDGVQVKILTGDNELVTRHVLSRWDWRVSGRCWAANWST